MKRLTAQLMTIAAGFMLQAGAAAQDGTTEYQSGDYQPDTMQEEILWQVSPITNDELDVLSSFPLWQDFIPIFGALQETISNLQVSFTDLEDFILEVQNLATAVGNLFIDALNLVGDFAGGVINDAGDWVSDTAGGIIDDVGGIVEDVGDAICFWCMALANNGEPFAFEPEFVDDNVATGGGDAPGSSGPNHLLGPAAALGGAMTASGSTGQQALQPAAPNGSSPQPPGDDAVGLDGLDLAAYGSVGWSDFHMDIILAHPVFHGVSGMDAWQVGLGLVDNTADLDKPISAPQLDALDAVPGLVSPPGSSDDAGEVGQWAVTEDYLYVCVAPATWARRSLNAW